MAVVTQLNLPEINYNTPDFGPRTYHEQLARARERGWLAHSPLAYIVLDGEVDDAVMGPRRCGHGTTLSACSPTRPDRTETGKRLEQTRTSDPVTRQRRQLELRWPRPASRSPR